MLFQGNMDAATTYQIVQCTRSKRDIICTDGCGVPKWKTGELSTNDAPPKNDIVSLLRSVICILCMNVCHWTKLFTILVLTQHVSTFWQFVVYRSLHCLRCLKLNYVLILWCCLSPSLLQKMWNSWRLRHAAGRNDSCDMKLRMHQSNDCKTTC